MTTSQQQFRGSTTPIRNISEAIGGRQNDTQLQNEIKNLKQELRFQMNINDRLGQELMQCQRRLGIEPGDAQLKRDEIQPTQYLGTDFSFLAPLFISYDERIANLDEMVESLVFDLKELDKKTHFLVEDNSFLRTQLEQKNELLLKGGTEDSIQGVFIKLEKEELQDRIRLFNEENHIYITKIKEYENRIYELQNRLEVYSKHEPSYVNEIHDLQEQGKKLEIDSDDLRIRRDVLENKLKNQIELNALLEEEKNEYNSKLSRADNEAKVFKHQLSSLRHALESSSEAQTLQLNELNKELESLKLRERDFFNKSIFQERELDQIKEDNRRLRKEVELTKSDLDQTMKMMENYENKISLFTKREENISRVSKDLREKNEQINLEKEKLSMREQHFDQTLHNIISKQREETHQLKVLSDKSIELLKARSRTQVEQRDNDIQRLSDETTQLTLLNEKLTKENKSIKLELNRLENSLRSDIENNYQQSDDLMRQITELTERLQLTEQSNHVIIAQFQGEKDQLESHLKNTQNSNADQRQALDHTRTQLTSATQELSTLKGKITQLTRSTQNLIDELQKTKKYNEQRLESLQDEFNHKFKNVQLQLDEAVKREKNSRERAVQLLQQYDQIEEKLKSEFQARIQDLEYQLSQTTKQNKALQSKASEYGTLKK